MFASYGLAFWYGSVLINDGNITAGEVVTVFFGTRPTLCWRGRTGPLMPRPSPRWSGTGSLPVVAAVIFGAMALGQGAPNVAAFATARGAAWKIFETIGRVPEIDTLSDEGLKPTSLDGNIEFDQVHFVYPTRASVPVLRGLTLSVKAGQTVALVGPSGCGKSTTLGLLERFYDPAQGTVRVDGHNIRTVGRLRGASPAHQRAR